MHDWQSLSHVRWECKYHVVIIPKFRRRVFYGKLKREVGAILPPFPSKCITRSAVSRNGVAANPPNTTAARRQVLGMNSA